MLNLAAFGSAVAAVAEEAGAAASWLGVLAEQANSLGVQGSDELWATEEG
jgi:hypothetical protein